MREILLLYKKKVAFYIQRCFLFTNRWGHYGFSTGASIDWNVYGSFRKVRYVDDTITFIKIGIVDYILSVLNNFHPNIQFTYDTKYNFKLAFLDVMLCRDGENFVTRVY